MRGSFIVGLAALRACSPGTGPTSCDSSAVPFERAARATCCPAMAANSRPISAVGQTPERYPRVIARRRSGWRDRQAGTVACPRFPPPLHRLVPGGMSAWAASPGGGEACSSTRSRAASRHAQFGALAAQIFITGCTDEGSSKLPTRITVNSGRADELPKRCEPHRGQKRRLIWLPLSAVLVNSLSSPEISSASVGTKALTEPLAARCWQCRHQQTRVVIGSAVRRKLTARQRQCPFRSVILVSSAESD